MTHLLSQISSLLCNQCYLRAPLKLANFSDYTISKQHKFVQRIQNPPNVIGPMMILHRLPHLLISPASLHRRFFHSPKSPENPISVLTSLSKSKSFVFTSPTAPTADCQPRLSISPLDLDDAGGERTELSSPSVGFPDVDEVRIELPVENLFIPPDVDVGSSSLSARVLKGSNIVLSRYARDAQITQAEFVKSSRKKEECPADGLPEFALVGRSNVGKSSLLNSLVRRRKLALTSKKPGKTQCINHFRVNDSWYLVDLPGYGYAVAPHEVRTDWSQFTKDYFLHRETLVSVFLLIDGSIPAKKIDLEYASWLGQNQIPMTLVFTKCDKRRKKRTGGKRAEENVEDFQNLIRESFETAPPWIMTSSVTNMGRDELLLHMAQLRNYWLKH